jgi:hypothetical protein
MVRLCDIPKTPRRYPEIAIHENECMVYLMEKAKKEGSYSILGLARWAAEFYATKLGEEDEGATKGGGTFGRFLSNNG